ncbi:hypothetical protein GCM10027570_23000 [Streptomonospora sediminis]
MADIEVAFQQRKTGWGEFFRDENGGLRHSLLPYSGCGVAARSRLVLSHIGGARSDVTASKSLVREWDSKSERVP